MTIEYEWRGGFGTREVNALHAEAFETRVFEDSEWDWSTLVHRHSLGWVVARADGKLVGFVNVPWDGLVHAWIQDTMVSQTSRHRGIATRLVEIARDAARDAGCEWLHVDFDEHLRSFYIDACGFAPTSAGLIALQEDAAPIDRRA
jgi:GNAT superfamily N-acetyltransferase